MKLYVPTQGLQFDIPETWEAICELKEELQDLYNALDKYEECPECKGTCGFFVDYEDSKGRIITVDHPCKYCEGKGYINTELI